MNLGFLSIFLPGGPLDLLALLEPGDGGLRPPDGPRCELDGATVLGPPVPGREQEEGEGGAGQRGRRVLDDPAMKCLHCIGFKIKFI